MSGTLSNKFTATVVTMAPPIKEYRIPVNKDSYILSNNPRTNYGEYKAAQIGNSKSNYAATLMEFKGLKDIPSNVLNNFIDATIKIAYSFNIKNDATINVNEYNSGNWEEHLIYWENAPAKGAPIYDDLPIPAGTKISRIDISDSFHSQMDKGEDIIGVYMNSDDAASSNPLCIYTKEYMNNPAYRPELIIRYYDIPGIPKYKDINGQFDVGIDVGADITGEVAVGKYSVKYDEFGGTLIVPKFTVFDMTLTTEDGTEYSYPAGYDVVSNKAAFDNIQTILANGDMKTSSSTGDMIISGELIISAPVGSEGISGTLKVPKLFAYTTNLLKKGEVVYTFPKGEDVDDYSYSEPYDGTEVDGDREITGEIKTTGFGGHHFINCNTGDMKVARKVLDIEDITGEVEVAVSAFDGEYPEISGEINITPLVTGDNMFITGDIKVPKLFAYTTNLTKDGTTVYTFPEGKDVDDYSYDGEYNGSEVDGNREITGTISTKGMRSATIDCKPGGLIVVLEADLGDNGTINCEKWDVSPSNYFDADMYVLAMLKDGNNLLTCDKSNVDYTQYENANMYVKAMKSVPTYYGKDGQVLPEKHNPEDVYRTEYTPETIINGVVGIPTTDPTIFDYTGKVDVSTVFEDTVEITCEQSAVDYTQYENANMYVKAMKSVPTYYDKDGNPLPEKHNPEDVDHIDYTPETLITGTVIVKQYGSKDINGTVKVYSVVEDGDNLIICDKSNVDYTQYENANMYVEAMKSVPTYYGKDGQVLPEKHNPEDVDHIDYTPETLITGSITAKLRKEVDITGSIDVYAKINNGGWIDCDKSNVEPTNYKDANMYVIRVMTDEITGDVTIKGVKSADITCDNELIIANEANIDIISGEVKVGHEADGAEITGEITIREAILKEIDGVDFEVEGPAPDTDINGKIDVKVDAPVEEITGTVEVSVDIVSSTSYGFIL